MVAGCVMVWFQQARAAQSINCCGAGRLIGQGAPCVLFCLATRQQPVQRRPIREPTCCQQPPTQPPAWKSLQKPPKATKTAASASHSFRYGRDLQPQVLKEVRGTFVLSYPSKPSTPNRPVHSQLLDEKAVITCPKFTSAILNGFLSQLAHLEISCIALSKTRLQTTITGYKNGSKGEKRSRQVKRCSAQQPSHWVYHCQHRLPPLSLPPQVSLTARIWSSFRARSYLRICS